MTVLGRTFVTIAAAALALSAASCLRSKAELPDGGLRPDAGSGGTIDGNGGAIGGGGALGTGGTPAAGGIPGSGGSPASGGGGGPGGANSGGTSGMAGGSPGGIGGVTATGGRATGGSSGGMNGSGGGGGLGGTGGRCGDGQKDPGEQCDLGSANRTDAYGVGMCTSECKTAPFCGDGVKNGSEQCDAAGSGSTNLGACNPECTGFYEKKFIRETAGRYSGNLGGPSGADQLCQTEFGNGWKALIVGGGRRATMTPLKGDGQTNWVVRKYTHYYNENDQLVWRTDDVALLGVRGGERMNLYANAFFQLAFYPWSGYDDNWVEAPRSDSPGASSGTCLGWMTIAVGEDGTFALPDLTMGRTEPCGGAQPLLCIQQ